MELLMCEDYHFYNNGVYKTISKLAPEGWFADLQKVEPSIRIFGTRSQIAEALDVYIEMTDLNLDECYDFAEEPKDSHFYDEESNKQIREKLAYYKERYLKQNNNKALITTI